MGRTSERLSRTEKEYVSSLRNPGPTALFDDIQSSLKKASLMPGEPHKYTISRYDLDYLQGEHALTMFDPRLKGSVEIHDIYHVVNENGSSENRIWVKGDAQTSSLEIPFTLEATSRRSNRGRSELIAARHTLAIPASARESVRNIASSLAGNIDSFAKSAFNRGLDGAHVTGFDVVRAGVIVHLQKDKESSYPR